MIEALRTPREIFGTGRVINEFDVRSATRSTEVLMLHKLKF